MKYLLIAPRPMYNKTNQPSKFTIHAAETLISLGHEVKIFTFGEFYLDCSYFQRKLYKIGFKGLETKYLQRMLQDLKNICEEFKPDCIIILNAIGLQKIIVEYISKYKIILRLCDSVKRFKSLEKFIPHVNEIFCFEYDDVEYLKEKYKLPIRYVPLGTDEKIYYPIEKKRDIDIAKFKYFIKVILFISLNNCSSSAIFSLIIKLSFIFEIKLK